MADTGTSTAGPSSRISFSERICDSFHCGPTISPAADEEANAEAHVVTISEAGLVNVQPVVSEWLCGTRTTYWVG
eukprot:2808728-Prymnesium_polylepis.1